MLRYHLDADKLKRLIAQRGYAHLTAFARAHGFNRATIHHFVKGDGPLSPVFYALCDTLQADPISLLTPMTGSEVPEASEVMPIVQALIATDKELAVGLLGSRAKRKARAYSDWDVGITRGRRALAGVEFFRIKRVAGDLTDALPRSVDFINLDQAPQWFLSRIDYEPVYLGGDPSAWAYFLGVLHGTKRAKQS
jgi:predicted nucleotidyltransferase